MEKTIDQLTAQIKAAPNNADLYMERALLYYKLSNLKAAYNDFVETLILDDKNLKAKQYIEVIDNIFSFEYRENYNV